MSSPVDTTNALVPGSIAGHATCLLLKLGQVVFRIVEARMAELGIRTRHYSVLQALADEGPAPQLELGRYLRIDPATMVSTLDDLQHLAAVTRTRSAIDRRRQVVEITEAGRLLLGRAIAVLDELDTTLFEELPDDDRRRLSPTLRALSEGSALPAALEDARG